MWDWPAVPASLALSGLGQGGEHGVGGASCDPVKGSDAGGRFGVKTQAAKPPV